MEFRNQNDDDDDLRTTTPPPQPTTTSFKASAFSRPTLPPSSSLLSSRSPPTTDHHSVPKSTDPCPRPKLSPLPPNSLQTPADAPYRYKECLRNHAANIGVHVVDGCGEFMPDSDDPFRCAACGCHRSFHRKEFTAADPRLPLTLPPPHPAKAFGFSAFPSSPAGMMAFGGNTSGSGGTTTESSSEERANAAPWAAPRKRFRTKFSAEQKDKMMAFAESVGWRIQKQDEAVVERFCAEAGVRRQVLKVWMHNNKHVVRRQQQQEAMPRREHLVMQQIQSPENSSQSNHHHH